MTKRLWLCSILALLLVSAVNADTSEAGALLERLSEGGKLPQNSDWGERLSEALAAETSETHTLHPLTLSIITDSIPGFSGNGDPAAAAELIAETMRTVDRQIRRGIAQPRIRQEAGRSLSGLNGLTAADAASGRGNRGRGTARAILKSLDNPGSGNIPFSSTPGMESGGAAIPGQGPSSVPERGDDPGGSENSGDGYQQDPPF